MGPVDNFIEADGCFIHKKMLLYDYEYYVFFITNHK